MRKVIHLSFIIGLILISSCQKNPCTPGAGYSQLDPRVPSYFYKVGSYWVYRDSADGITDSQSVIGYQYNIHIINPADTPTPNAPHGGALYCGPSYYDKITMHIQSVQNGVYKDTITFYAAAAGVPDPPIAICNTYMYPSSETSATGFFLGWTNLGFLDCCYSLTPQGTGFDTSGSWYDGMQTRASTGSYTFSNVSIWGIQIGDGSSVRFAYPTDLYIKDSVGIVKMVQHLPTGYVQWDLINYHIIN